MSETPQVVEVKPPSNGWDFGGGVFRVLGWLALAVLCAFSDCRCSCGQAGCGSWDAGFGQRNEVAR